MSDPTKHDGDCTIYASIINDNPEDGICTCGYGRHLVRNGNYSEMYSKELDERKIIATPTGESK